MKKSLFTLIMLLFTLSAVHAQEKRYTIPLEDSPSLGPANAPVTVVEFIDYQ